MIMAEHRSGEDSGVLQRIDKMPGVFQGMVGHFQQPPFLRIKTRRLDWGDGKKRRIELFGPPQKTTMTAVAGARLFRVG
ncbi:hypothetical protein D3C73_978370 [compost metagenome]